MNKIIPLAAAAVIAVASYFVAGTPIDEAVQIAFDMEKAKVACDAILNR